MQLTLDMDIQKLAETFLGPQPGSVVILDVRDNSVLAMASYPLRSQRVRHWLFRGRLEEAERRPGPALPEPAGGQLLPHGSVFKVVTMAAGLEHGGFKGATSSTATAVAGLGNGEMMGDWLPGATDTSTSSRGWWSPATSSSTRSARSWIPSTRRSCLRSPGASASASPPASTACRRHPAGAGPGLEAEGKKDSWYLGDTVNLGIGQGFFLATPLQVANAYAAIARGGSLRPRCWWQSGGARRSRPSRRDAARPASDPGDHPQGMKQVTADPKGTAY